MTSSTSTEGQGQCQTQGSDSCTYPGSTAAESGPIPIFLSCLYLIDCHASGNTRPLIPGDSQKLQTCLLSAALVDSLISFAPYSQLFCNSCFPFTLPSLARCRKGFSSICLCLYRLFSVHLEKKNR